MQWAGSHGLSSGIIAVVQSGNFGHGFISAALTKAADVNRLITGTEDGMNTARTVIAGLIGGTISKITGGKFANGAATAALAQAYNGNSFWDKVKVVGEIALSISPVGGIADCMIKGCGYFEWRRQPQKTPQHRQRHRANLRI